MSNSVKSCAPPAIKRAKRDTYNLVCFDIETTNLSADFGVVLCAAYWRSGMVRPRVLSQRLLNPDWERSSANDCEVVRRLLAELDRADFWVAHNGANFDLPFLHTRAAVHGIVTPSKRALLDPVVVARRHFRLSSNRLAHLSSYFHVGEKSGVEPALWMQASLARDNSAMRAIERHCVQDVCLLARLAPLFRGQWRNLGSTGTFF